MQRVPRPLVAADPVGVESRFVQDHAEDEAMNSRWLTLLTCCLVLSGCQATKYDLAAPTLGASASALPIREFARQTFIHGVPYEEAGRYDGSAVPVLLNMLEDPEEEPHWANIVITLGMIGDERSVDPLIGFLSKEEQEPLSHARYTAKSSVPMALGYLVNKSGNKKALAYLKDHVYPDSWGQDQLKWQSPYHANKEARDQQLSTMAVLGLALSGHPEAKETLREMKKPAKTDAAIKFQAQVGGVVDEALTANEAIAKDGLAGYYRKATP